LALDELRTQQFIQYARQIDSGIGTIWSMGVGFGSTIIHATA